MKLLKMIELLNEKKELDFSCLIFHTFEYKKFIEDAFGCRYDLLIATNNENGAVETIFPFVEVKSLIFKNRLISSAYLEYGGFAGDSKNIPAMLNFLKEKYSKKKHYLEIRAGLQEFDQTLSKQLIKKDLYKRFILELKDKETLWRSIQKSKRKAVKKALSQVEVKEIPKTEINKFYQLYAKNMRRFGSPPYSKKYFESFYKNIAEKGFGRILGAYKNNTLTSALLGFCYNRRVHILIAVSDQKYQHLRPNDALHWTFIEWAVDNNYNIFDFGRVREESGQFEYKRKWGPELLPLPSYFDLYSISTPPLIYPKGHTMIIKIWQHLPLWLTKLIGMRLRKELGI